MIGLDTNVLVRYFAQDHKVQSARATALIESLNEQNPGFVSLVTLVELVWVMQAAYDAKKEDVVTILQMLLQTREIIVQHTDVALQALTLFSEAKAGFADCLIERMGHHAGCSHTVTFDKDAAHIAGMLFLGA